MTHPKLRCSRCESSKLIPDVSIVDHGYMDARHELAVEMQGKPEAFVFKDRRKGVIKATICGDCGHVDLSIENAAELWQIHRKTSGHP